LGWFYSRNGTDESLQSALCCVEKAYLTACKVNLNLSGILCDVAALYESLGSFGSATRVLVQALETVKHARYHEDASASNIAEISRRLVSVYITMGHYLSALDMFESLDSTARDSSPVTHLRRALCLYAVGREHEALSIAHHCIRINTTSWSPAERVRLYSLVGDVLTRCEQFQDAQVYLHLASCGACYFTFLLNYTKKCAHRHECEPRLPMPLPSKCSAKMEIWGE
jgi:tetratricopeptide (TPR) repeat protein